MSTQVSRVASFTRKAPMPKEKQLALCAEYKAGQRPVDLSKKYGVHFTSIYGILKRNGVKIEYKNRTPGTDPYGGSRQLTSIPGPQGILLVGDNYNAIRLEKAAKILNAVMGE